MKKIFITTILTLFCYIINAQVTTNTNPKKFIQLSVRGGLDLATKKNFTDYINAPLKGFDAGLSFDKYWNWYGVGVDVDFLSNQKPVYNNEAGLTNDIAVNSGNFFVYNTTYKISNNATKLSRSFIGVGPSLKYQSNNNKFVAELNLRGGITMTKGSGIQYSTNADASLPSWFHNMLTRNGNTIPGLPSIQSWGTFYHDGYKNDILATAKAQLRLNYYVKPKIGVNLGAYYMHYFGSDAKYNYIDWAPIPPSHNYWSNPVPLSVGLTSLSSMGITAGVSYRIGAANTSNASKSAKNNITVNVKDELTGQPITDATVTIVNTNGKTYTATTNATGLVNFTKVEDGNYTVNGSAHDIATNQQSAMVNSSNRNANATLIHNDPRFTVVGKAINLNGNKPEAGVSVSLKNNDKGSIKMGTSQSGTGSFTFQIDANSDYELVGKKASYISNIEKVSTKGLTRSQTLYVELEIGVAEVEKGKALVLQNIYYDVDKANIREEASSDLEKLTTFLQDNPTFTIEIASHTDSRGSDEYNLKLSTDRAQAVANYISKKGIDKNRLSAKGYGESKLINKCANGVTCTEAEHQLNRRTEFTVINN
jgi:outer membrane protein OmpA-like peptidoglycan-associated protein